VEVEKKKKHGDVEWLSAILGNIFSIFIQERILCF